MGDTLQEFIDRLPVVDVHEHHLPELLGQPGLTLLGLFRQSYAGWAAARPYILPHETRDADPMLVEAGPCTWEDLEPFLERHGSNSFVRNLVWAVTQLYGEGDTTIDRGNWERLDTGLRRHHGQPGWPRRILERAGIEQVITDVYTNPLCDARQAFGESYHSVMRINAFACGWHPDSRDHNDNRAHELLARLGSRPATFDEYLAALENVVDGLAGRHQVALKNALAYDRALDFDEPDEALARRAWGQIAPSAAERKGFGDFIVDRFCRWAGERDVPVQMHLGSALIRGSHPLRAAGLIERHPRTRFLLMHLAYPWSRDLLGLAFVYRNIWLDLTWAPLLSPTHFQAALHEAIEVLPDESRMMFGGDNWHAEETFGAIQRTRRLLSQVLTEKVGAGYFAEADARRLAEKICHQNARAFFRI
jgi:hypothetical protein